MVDESTTEGAILDAAVTLFARQGYARTTIKQIAGKAGVNSALLYYYFESKERLYREVLRRLLSQLAAAASREMPPMSEPEDAIRGFVHLQVAFLSARPDAPRLIARELADHGAEHAVEAITESIATTFSRLCDVIREGQRSGRFRTGIRPEFAAISTVAQVAYLFLARPAVAIVLGHGRKGIPAQVMSEFADHAAEFALAALRQPAEAPVAGARR